MSRKLNLIGQTFGRLSVISESDKKRKGRTAWLCRCSCGNTNIVTTHDLQIGSTRSCGCLKHDNKSQSTHGDCSTPEYKAWTAMKDRCYGVNHSSYESYHGRGIVVCEEWVHSYENFLRDMGRKPHPKMSLDRKDNNGNYCLENCRWATIKEQNNNSRNCRIIEHNGESKTMKQWAEACNIGYHLLRDRIDVLGWSFSKAISVPKRVMNKKSMNKNK